jgi:hypothetical protein
VNGLFAAAGEVQRLCEDERWRFCFIGGLAVQRWGEARVTRDVDRGALPFEECSVARASSWEVPGTAPLRTCTAEDLVVHKVSPGETATGRISAG